MRLGRRLRALERRCEVYEAEREAERAALIASIEAMLEDLQLTPEGRAASTRLQAEWEAELHQEHGTAARRSPQ